MAIYDGDQPTVMPVVINGVVTPGTPARIKSLAGPGTTAYRFTAPFVLHHAGSSSPMHYRRGASYLLDGLTVAALQLVSAPMIAL